MPTIEITLTTEQQHAVDLAVSGIREARPMTRIGGYAGTGKTTLIHAINAAVGGSHFGITCAYTGKAACELRFKGVRGACTIHSVIYRPHEEIEIDPKTKKERIVIKYGRIPEDQLTAQFFIIDEASMVGKEILDDLVSFKRPIIAIGDPGQLPPISKHDVNLMAEPDFVLNEIHRQAEGSGIVQLATEIRTGPTSFAMELPALELDDVSVIGKHEATCVRDADVFICGFNKTRHNINHKVRRRSKLTGVITVGERIIALANDQQRGVFNGLMGTVEEIIETATRTLYPRGEDEVEVTIYRCSMMWDGEEKAREIWISGASFGSDVENSLKIAHFGSGLVLADYGYAITAHKAQGSQWDRVVVINEAWPKAWCQKRWLYTAATRAAKSLVVGSTAV